MRVALCLVVLLAACDSGTVDNTSPSAWNEAVDAYVAATCVDLEPCTQEDPDTCEAAARDELEALRETVADRSACVTCLEELAQQHHDQSFTCDPADVDMEALMEACGDGNDACDGFGA